MVCPQMHWSWFWMHKIEARASKWMLKIVFKFEQMKCRRVHQNRFRKCIQMKIMIHIRWQTYLSVFVEATPTPLSVILVILILILVIILVILLIAENAWNIPSKDSNWLNPFSVHIPQVYHNFHDEVSEINI